MANKGWDSTQGGEAWSSTARQSGRQSGTDGAASFVQGSKIADPGNHNDPMDERGDVFGAPGQLSTC